MLPANPAPRPAHSSRSTSTADTADECGSRREAEGASAPVLADAGRRVVDEAPAMPGGSRGALLAIGLLAALALKTRRVLVEPRRGDRVHQVHLAPVPDGARALRPGR